MIIGELSADEDDPLVRWRVGGGDECRGGEEPVCRRSLSIRSLAYVDKGEGYGKVGESEIGDGAEKPP